MFGLSGAMFTGLTVAGVVMVAGLGIQTIRLEHAKKDQVDQSTHVKWEKEYKDQSKVLAANTQKLEACNASFQSLSANVAAQNSAVLALQASGETLAANSGRAVQAVLAATAISASRTQRVARVKETTCPALDELRSADQ